MPIFRYQQLAYPLKSILIISDYEMVAKNKRSDNDHVSQHLLSYNRKKTIKAHIVTAKTTHYDTDQIT